MNYPIAFDLLLLKIFVMGFLVTLSLTGWLDGLDKLSEYHDRFAAFWKSKKSYRLAMSLLIAIGVFAGVTAIAGIILVGRLLFYGLYWFLTLSF